MLNPDEERIAATKKGTQLSGGGGQNKVRTGEAGVEGSDLEAGEEQQLEGRQGGGAGAEHIGRSEATGQEREDAVNTEEKGATALTGEEGVLALTEEEGSPKREEARGEREVFEGAGTGHIMTLESGWKAEEEEKKTKTFGASWPIYRGK